jgi:hypothetical protein
MEEAGFQVTDATEMRMWGLPIDIIIANKEQCL